MGKIREYQSEDQALEPGSKRDPAREQEERILGIGPGGQERRLRGPWQVGEPNRRYSDEAYKFWQERYPFPLTGEDVRKIVLNLATYFNFLIESDRLLQEKDQDEPQK